MFLLRRPKENKKSGLSVYYESFDKARELAEEAVGAIAGDRWAKESSRISIFLERNRYSADFVARLSSAQYNRRIYDTVNGYDIKNETNDILALIGAVEKKAELRRKNIRHYTLAGTAAALVTVIMWLLPPINKYDEITSDLSGENVNLVLPDGRIIVVDEIADNSNIVDEKRTVISKDKNSIVVEKKTEEEESYAQPLNYHTLNVPRGFRHDIVLEDGTHVWLNSGSTLKFPSIFAADERRVFLEGEGYFEVTRDSLRAFVVETQEQTLTVLGTKFNIYAYSDESVIYSTLLTGSVRVSVGDKEITLRPNQCSELVRNSGIFEIRAVDASAIASWRNGILVFDNNTLEQVLMKISRSYDVEIIFDRDKVRDFAFNGNLPRYNDIWEMFENIEMAGQVKFKVENGRYIMTMQ